MFRKHFNAATAVAVVALVFAMAGGAYAAGKYLITSTKQISPKVLKSLQGKPGKAGANGANGAQGPAGAQGPGGPAGPTGPQGPQGEAGKNGENGKEGKEGPPGPFVKTLPAGATLKGEWGLIATVSAAEAAVSTSVSFGIPLAAAPVAHYLRTDGQEPFYNATTEKAEERSQSACIGSAAAPKATSGNLCIYASREEDALTAPFPGVILPTVCPFSAEAACIGEANQGTADPYGFGLVTFAEKEGLVNLAGTWAVTG
jgi:hypothetical protein